MRSSPHRPSGPRATRAIERSLCTPLKALLLGACVSAAAAGGKERYPQRQARSRGRWPRAAQYDIHHNTHHGTLDFLFTSITSAWMTAPSPALLLLSPLPLLLLLPHSPTCNTGARHPSTGPTTNPKAPRTKHNAESKPVVGLSGHTRQHNKVKVTPGEVCACGNLRVTLENKLCACFMGLHLRKKGCRVNKGSEGEVMDRFSELDITKSVTHGSIASQRSTSGPEGQCYLSAFVHAPTRRRDSPIATPYNSRKLSAARSRGRGY